ncbi:MAG: ImmA/IrrE family metallo-endopeptidase [Planctomycetaceae bacterium]|nr:ImmA/IrrE family metallo-endopeptidase [Planctomycetaceae bacterium]
MTQSARSTQALIDELIRSTGCNDAPAAIRAKAKELLDLHVTMLGEPSLPISVDVLASLRGIGRSDDVPVHSPDAELVPDGRGGVTMRVNPDRPETRQRFSVAHEISHTFFPDYASKEWCRTDARYRNRETPEDYLEMLCDIGAAELLFPQPWFGRDAAAITDAPGIIALSATYHASREAVIRRYAETSPESVAAVFFIWKLKPTQKGTVGNPNQINLFGISAEDELREARRLRIEYSIASETFKADGHFLPKDKSVENDGPIYRAAATGSPVDDQCHLDFGQASGTYRVSAIPLWTAQDELGASGEQAVAAILRPVSVRRPVKKRSKDTGPGLF